MQAAIEEQEREAAALAAIEAGQAGCGDGCEAAAAAAAGGEEQGDFELVLDWSAAGGAQGLAGPTSEWLADLSLEPQPAAGGDGEGAAAGGDQPGQADGDAAGAAAVRA